MPDIRELMSTNVITVGSREDLSTVVSLMESNHIRHLPVVDDENHVVGLVSHRDLLRTVLHAVDELPGSDRQAALGLIKVEEVMARGVETVDPDDALVDVATMMMENKFGCVPVTEGALLVGILTETDFMRYVVESNA